MLLCRRGNVGTLGLEDLAAAQHRQHPCHVPAHLPDAGGVVELAGGQLEAHEQLAPRVAQAGGELVAVEHGEVVSSWHQTATSG